MIHQGKRALLEGASGVFERGGRKAPEVDKEQVKDLHVDCHWGLPHVNTLPLRFWLGGFGVIDMGFLSVIRRSLPGRRMRSMLPRGGIA
jgi:hypothetical protein